MTGLTSQYAVNEAERNLAVKLPAATTPFKLILKAAVTVARPPTSSLVQSLADQAHAKDVPILAAAIANEAGFLATFNVRHFSPRKIPPLIRRPGELVGHIRRSLVHLLN